MAIVFEPLLRSKPVVRGEARRTLNAHACTAAEVPIGVGKRGAPFRKPRYGKPVTEGGREGEGGVRLLGSQGMLPPPKEEGAREDGVTWC